MHNSVNTLKSTGLEILFFLHIQTALFIYFGCAGFCCCAGFSVVAGGGLL